MTILVSQPAELLATVPYQFGFHPQRSVVVLVTRDGLVRFGARLDVPDDPARADEVVADACDRLGWQIAQEDGDGAVLALYDECALGWGTLLAVGDQVALWGLGVVFSAVVADGHWRELGSGDPGTWGTWHRLPDPQACSSVAELVGMGKVAAGDRDTALARVRADAALLAAAAPLTARERRVPVRAVSEWRAFFRLGSPDEPDGWSATSPAALRLSRSLLCRDFRDALITVLVPGVMPSAALDGVALQRAQSLAGALLRPPAPRADELGWDDRSWAYQRTAGLLERFLRLARSAPRPVSAGPYVVAAVLAGRLGEGYVCAAAVEEALAADPDHVLAQILAELLAAGLLPGRCTDEPGHGGDGAA